MENKKKEITRKRATMVNMVLDTKINEFIEIVGENYFGFYKSTRYACRGIVIKDDNILLSLLSNKDFWMIPGGGREKGENDIECVIRELHEETGYIVNVVKQTVKVIEYYEDVRYVSVFFLCNIVNEAETNLTDGEKAEGLERRWIPFKEALSIFKEHNKYKDIYEEKRGAYLREYSALLKMIDNNDI